MVSSVPNSAPEPSTDSADRRAVLRDALGVGLATGAYGVSFGALAVAGGLSPLQAQVLSLVMFTGASQFALIGVLASGGGAVSAVLTSWLLGARNALYGLRLAPLLAVRGPRKLAAAHLTIDESTAMALGRLDREPEARLAFWATGLNVFFWWNLATLVGSLGASALGDPKVLGLDAAIPAGFVALLWPRLQDRQSRPLHLAVALAGAAVALSTTPWLPAGVPVLAAGVVAIVAGLRDPWSGRRRTS